MSPRAQILIAGQGGPLNPEDEAQYGSLDAILATIFAQVEKLQTAGFDCTPFLVDPRDPADGYKQYNELLASKRWDMLVIGFGIRGKKEFTEVFETIVNVCREKSLSTKMGFTTGPDDLFATVTRLAGEHK